MFLIFYENVMDVVGLGARGLYHLFQIMPCLLIVTNCLAHFMIKRQLVNKIQVIPKEKTALL